MKNSQKGFIVPLLLVIIAVLVVGGGVYIYENKKTEAPVVIDTETQQSNQTILNELVTDWKKIGPSILPGFPAVSQAFYGYPDIIQFIGNNRIVISYQDDFNPLFAVLSYDSNQKQFSYLDGLRSSPFKVSEILWNTWRNKYGDVSFAPQTYQFSSTRTGDIVYSSDWKLITKNPFISSNSQVNTQSPINQNSSVNQVVEKTALLSFTEFFCGWTEQSKPFAYFQFAYQDSGEIKYVKTKTTCDDLIKIGASNDASKNPTLFGEKIKLQYSNGKPIKITRENGNTYSIEYGEQIRSFFSSKINIYDNLKYFRNSNSDQVTKECLLIKDNNQHDSCLSYQAAFQENIGICSKMIISSNQDLCTQWVNNIKQGSVNN